MALALLPLAHGAGPVEVESHAYLGTTTRDPLLGPVVVCADDGSGVGGACFTNVTTRGFAVVVVHDAMAEGHVPVIVYAYDALGLPLDGKVACPHNHEGFVFQYDLHQTRKIVVGVGPAARVGGAVCPGLAGTSGTIDVLWY